MSSLGILIWQYFGKKNNWKKLFFISLQNLNSSLRGLSFYPAFEVSSHSKQESSTWAWRKLLKAQNISKIKWVINQKKKEVRNLEFIKAKEENAHGGSEKHPEMDTPRCLFWVSKNHGVWLQYCRTSFRSYEMALHNRWGLFPYPIF